MIVGFGQKKTDPPPGGEYERPGLGEEQAATAKDLRIAVLESSAEELEAQLDVVGFPHGQGSALVFSLSGCPFCCQSVAISPHLPLHPGPLSLGHWF